MAYVNLSDFTDSTMPDIRDICILFKAVADIYHNNRNKEDISLNIENILYDADKGSVRFMVCKNRRNDIYTETRELIAFLVSRLKYAKEDVYMFINDIKRSFDKDGAGGIYNVIAAYEKEKQDSEMTAFVSELIFIICMIIAQALYYKMTGIAFFK